MCLQRVWEESTQTLSPVLIGSKRVSSNIFFHVTRLQAQSPTSQKRDFPENLSLLLHCKSPLWVVGAPLPCEEAVLVCLWMGSLMFTDDVAAADNSRCNLLTFRKTLQPQLFCTGHAGHLVLQESPVIFQCVSSHLGSFLDELNSHSNLTAGSQQKSSRVSERCSFH